MCVELAHLPVQDITTTWPPIALLISGLWWGVKKCKQARIRWISTVFWSPPLSSFSPKRSDMLEKDSIGPKREFSMVYEN